MQNVLNNIYIGLVINNKDPIKKGRVQVFIPHITNTLYTGWNDNNKNIKFRTFDSDVFTPEITQRLIDTLPWAEVAAPFFGGGTGAPISNGQPKPIPTTPTAGFGEFMVGGEAYDTPAGNIPEKNIKKGVNVEKLHPKIKSDLVEFFKIFPDAVVSSGAEGKRGDNIHGFNSRHYPENNKDDVGEAFDLKIKNFDAATKKDIYLDAKTQQKYVEFFATRGYQGIGYEKIDGVDRDNDHIHIQLPSLGGRYGTFGPDGTKGSLSQTPEWFQAFNKKMVDGDFTSKESPKNQPILANGINNHQAEISLSSSISKLDPKEIAARLIDQRKGFIQELQDPKIKQTFYTIIKAEVGSYSERDKKMFIESVMNRTYARKGEGNTLDSPNYYGRRTLDMINSNQPLPEETTKEYDKLVNEVITTGLNLSNFATGNNQIGDGIGYAGGPETVIGDSERFGIEGNKNDKKWAKDLGVDVENLKPYTGKEGRKVAKTNQDLNNDSFYGVAEVSNKGGAMGFLSVPHIGSKAYVMFLDGNHLRPIVIGAFKETSNG